jgi:hypothetical protein
MTTPLLVPCPLCDGLAVVGRCVWVCEHGCGIPHEDTEEDECPECEGTGRVLALGDPISLDDLDRMGGPLTALDGAARPPHKGPGILPYGESAVTPKQFQEALDKLGVSQRGARLLLDVDERQIRRWVAGDSRIPSAVAKLLRLMIKHGISPDEVEGL